MHFPEIIGENKFTQGRLTYSDHFGNDDSNARIVISIIFGERTSISAIVDTGAPWCIISPEEFVATDGRFIEEIGATSLWVRGTLYSGILCRVPMRVPDEGYGTDVTLQATVFIPTLKPGEVWLHPNFLGLSGFLGRLRFAVDPEENAFYFGAMEE